MRRLPGLSFTLLIWCVSSSAQVNTVQSAPAGGSGLVASIQPGGSQRSSFGALWRVGPSVTTDLVLRRSIASSSALVTLYGADGEVLSSSPVRTSNKTDTTINLTTLLPQDGKLRQGGLALSWSGVPLVEGRVEIHAEGGQETSYLLSGGLSADTENALYAPWYIPAKTASGMISMSNAGALTITVQTSLLVDGAEKRTGVVQVAPNASQTLDLRTLLVQVGAAESKTGTVVLRYTGAPHSLQPSLLLSDATSGYALMPDFLPLCSQAQDAATGKTDWQIPAVSVPVGDPSSKSSSLQLASYALLSNPKATPLTVILRAYSMDGWKDVNAQLPEVQLGAYETRLVSLNDAITEAHLGQSLSHIGLTIEHPGPAGRIGIALFTANQTGKILTVPKAIVLAAGANQVVFWNTAQRHMGSTYGIKLQDGKPAFMTFYYESSWGVGHYTFPQLPVNPGASTTNYAPKLPPTQRTPDGYGITPAGVTSGLIILSPAAPDPVSVEAAQPSCKAQCPGIPSAVLSAPASLPRAGSRLSEPSLLARARTSSPRYFSDADPNKSGIAAAPMHPHLVRTNFDPEFSGARYLVNANQAAFEPTASLVEPKGSAANLTLAGSSTRLAVVSASTRAIHPIFQTSTGTSPPPPCIGFNGAQCVQTQTVSVTVGQQIVLTGNIPHLRHYDCCQSQSWNWASPGQPDSYAIGCNSSFDYETTNSTCQVPTGSSIPSPSSSADAMIATSTTGFVPSNYPLPDTSNPNNSADNSNDGDVGSVYTFWWVYPPSSGSQELQFTYTATNGLTPATVATITFNVQGVTSPSISATSYQDTNSAAAIIDNNGATTVSNCNGVQLAFGHFTGSCTGVAPPFGIASQLGGTAPSSSGTFKWLQTVNSDETIYTNPPYSPNKVCTIPGADGGYPFPSTGIYPPGSNEPVDAPFGPLPDLYVTASRNFSATLYLLWNPSTSNSIDVPLVSEQWGFNFQVQETQYSDSWSATSSSGNGGVTSGPTQADGTQTNMGYPSWNAQAVPNGGTNCP